MDHVSTESQKRYIDSQVGNLQAICGLQPSHSGNTSWHNLSEIPFRPILSTIKFPAGNQLAITNSEEITAVRNQITTDNFGNVVGDEMESTLDTQGIMNLPWTQVAEERASDTITLVPVNTLTLTQGTQTSECTFESTSSNTTENPADFDELELSVATYSSEPVSETAPECGSEFDESDMDIILCHIKAQEKDEKLDILIKKTEQMKTHHVRRVSTLKSRCMSERRIYHRVIKEKDFQIAKDNVKYAKLTAQQFSPYTVCSSYI